MKPEIQISLGPELVQNYPTAVEAFGGTPAAAYLPEPEPEHYDGLILSGVNTTLIYIIKAIVFMAVILMTCRKPSGVLPR